ncbi:hypothetical protein P167DRAFT_574077 [Morchella conica CCBAS932]|uniref:Uncharacterized protein n=1 Tax=Morchella conica CCBAS932 TaxID=1392247 RepID=A0A3N4KQD5_9PEZI|nr:hypothetical protein P167DRAFT_574077 [Morchella conica CCBAS932]
MLLSFGNWRIDNNGDSTGTETDHGSPDEKDNEDDNDADDEDDNVISEHFE